MATLPWDFSGAGRKSSVGLQRLRVQVTGGSKASVGHAQIAAPADLAGAAAAAAAGSSQSKEQQQRVVSLEIEDPSVPEETKAKARSPNTGSSQTLRSSAAFKGDRTRIRTGRFLGSQPTGVSEAPEAGRYRPGLDLVTRRTSTVDFRERPKHQRRTPTPDAAPGSTSLQGGPSSEASSPPRFQRSSLRGSSPTESPRRSITIVKVDPMKLQPGRPDLVESINKHGRIAPIKMTELTEVSHNKDEQYKLLSTAHRYGEIHFEHYTPRKAPVKENFFQPGRYAVQLPAQAGAVTFAQSSRWEDEAEKPAGASARRDLSMARDSPAAKPRVLNIQDFSKSGPRFGSTSPSRSIDEEDELAQLSLERAMTFDLGKAHKAVQRKPSSGPPNGMKRTLPRETGSLGHRTFQSDLGLMTLHGYVGGETSVQFEPSVLEDAPVGRRRDMHLLPFDRLRGRPSDENKPANTSPLRKPRHHLPPEFSRIAPQTGFASRSSLGGARVQPSRRTYTAVAGWDTHALDSEAVEDDKVTTTRLPSSAASLPTLIPLDPEDLRSDLAATAPLFSSPQAASVPTLPIGRPGTSPCG
mmetsp:Transcript_31232/g.57102  ORF Transcript_31232/g.57102 Transcript_31232/m.57102 type:complete len:581 (-) Transcript_31232:68-1810(-)